MAEDRVAALLEVLKETELLSAGRLARLRDDPLARGDDPKPLLKQLVQRGWLTRFQAQMLAQNRGRELLIGQYRLLDRIGEGGMGQVFKAQHPVMNRIVALKIIRKERLSKPNAARRFYQEIQVAAKVGHPNIVHAYDAGQIGDTHYYAMEFVDGIDLLHLVHKSGPLPVIQACEYVRQAAVGLQHVHERGLVHRDMKPSNLLVTQPAGGASVGLVKVLDLGLARVRRADEEETGITREEQMMGTPDYLSPEQARNSRDVDIRADLYSLGCTFYFLLTGKVPFPSQSLPEVLLKHQMEEPAPLEQFRTDVPPGVQAILRKLMAKRPADRYQTPIELVDALQPYCGPEGASQPGSMLGGAFEATEWGTLTEAAPNKASESATVVGRRDDRRPVPRQRKWLLLLLGVGSIVVLGAAIGLAMRRLPQKDDLPAPSTVVTAIEQTVVVPPIPKQPSKPKVEAPVVKPVPVPEVVPERFAGHSSWILSLAISPDGRTILSGSADKTVRLWDADTGQSVRTFRGHDHSVQSVAFVPDGRHIVSAGLDATIRLWDQTTGQEVRRFLGHDQQINNIAVSGDGRRLLTGGNDKVLRLWDIASGKELRAFRGHADAITAVGFAQDGGQVLSASSDRTARLWDAETGKELAVLEGQEGPILSAALAPHGRTVLTSGLDGGIRVWSASTKQELRRLAGHTGAVSSVAFGPDSRLAISGGADGSVRLWDVELANQIHRFEGHGSGVKCVALSSDGRKAASGGLDKLIRLWDLPTIVLPVAPTKPAMVAKEVARAGHAGAITAAAFTLDGGRIVTGSRDGTLYIWRIQSGKEETSIDVGSPILDLAWTLDGHRFAAVAADGRALMYDRQGKLVSSHPAFKGGLVSLACNVDGSLVLLGAGEAAAFLWAPDRAGMPRRLAVGGGAVTSVAFSPDSRVAYLGSNDGQVRIKNAETGKDMGRNLPGHRGAVRSLAVSPDGTLLLTGGADRTLRLWDLARRQELLKYPGELGRLATAAFSADGRRVLAGGDDKRVRLYESRSGKLLVALDGHTDAITRVGFSPDSRYVFSAAADGSVRTWDVTTGREFRQFGVQRGEK